MDSNEATSLILRILNLANPHPPEKAAERVDQMRELLRVPVDVKRERKPTRKAKDGIDRKHSGGENRGGE